MKTLWIPENLRPPEEPEIVAVDTRLRDGRIIRDVAYNRKGNQRELVPYSPTPEERKDRG